MAAISYTPGSRTIRASGRALAVAVSFFAVCGAATAESDVTAKVVVAPVGGQVPAGICTTTNNFYVCVDPEPIQFAGTAPGANVKITWTLSGQGWTFVKNKGIDIKNRKNWKLKEDNSTQYTATNKKETNVLYKYQINVTNGSLTLPWDPTIMN